MHVREQEYDRAAPYLGRAVQQQSKSFLTYYYHSNLLLRSGAEESAFSAAEASLVRCVQLNPQFAPAHAELARIYSRREDTLDKALQSAKTAIALEPSNWNSQLALAGVLARRREFGAAREIADRVGANASESAQAEAAASMLTFIAQSEQYEADRRRYEESRRQIAESPYASDPVSLARRGNETDPSDQLPTRASGSSEVSPAVSEAADPSADTNLTPRPYSMRGQIVVLDCSVAPKVSLTLSLGTFSMKLIASDFSQVTFLDAMGDPLPQRPACERLQGLTARILYRLTPGESWDGEFYSVSLQALVP
jgi:tetratricopeptide (TPR) repeat protein